MVNFDSFKPNDNIAIYLQIVDYIKRGIISQKIVNGDELPSRRVLSATLAINPNTVQKAFKLLEEEGLIESIAGSGSFLTIKQDTIKKLKSELLIEDVQEFIHYIKITGLDKQETIDLIEKYWGRE